MVRKNPKIGKSQIAGGIKVQLPLDSPLIGVLKTDQYDVVNLYTNQVVQSFVPGNPGEGGEIVDPCLEDNTQFGCPGYVDPVDPGLPAPNLEDIVLIGSTGKRYSSGQIITDPEIYYDANNNRFLKVTFEVKNSVGDTVKGAIII
jgi:hypothetical protein